MTGAIADLVRLTSTNCDVFALHKAQLTLWVFISYIATISYVPQLN